MKLSELLTDRCLVVADGAMGTQLMDRGLEPGRPGETWSLENPDAVLAVHREYVEAGADLLLTNTFGANPITLARHGLADRTEELNAAGVRLARQAAGAHVLVIGDVSSTGVLLQPYGTLAEDEARAAFERQAGALIDAGVDAVLCETFQSLDELRIALEAVRACDTVISLIASLTFQEPRGNAYRSIMGDSPEDLVQLAGETCCDAVGTNCGQGIGTMTPLVAQIAALTDLPVFVKPNAGMPQLVDGQTVYREDPSVFGRYVPDVHAAGGRIIGGCDGTTGEHVAVVRRFADSL